MEIGQDSDETIGDCVVRHVIPISGKDSCATALVQMARQPNLPYELFFSDVGVELPETYAWLNKVEVTLQLPVPVHRVGKSLEQVIRHEGILPSPKVRFCTREAKIKPMEDWLGDDECIVYFGIRADEDRAGYQPLTKHNVHSCYPLKEMGIDLGGVYSIVRAKGLEPPKFFWEEMHIRISEIIDGLAKDVFGLGNNAAEVFAKFPSWVFDRLFAWRTRSNCYWCMFQAEWEWVGLLEHHPDLFDHAEKVESEVGNDRQEKPYTWHQGMSLNDIRNNADNIKAKRADAILKIIQTKQIVRDPVDDLSITSCGMFCGK